MTSRLIVLGFDGATFDLIDPWIAQGFLQNFAELANSGCRGVLRSTIQPMSPQAWATFQTGVNPGKHGIYQFTESDLHQPPTPVTSSSLGAPPFWRHFSSAGRTVGVVNVFATYPPEPINGFIIAGRNVPSGKEYMFPSSLAAEIQSQVGTYIIDVDPYHVEEAIRDVSEEEFLDLLFRMLDTRIRTFWHLQKNYNPDLLVTVFTVTDMVQHFFWHYLDPEHPHYPGSSDRTGRSAILDVYRRLDGFLGDVMDEIDPQDTLVVLSDHGFGPWYKELNLNRWLIEAGYLSLTDENGMTRLLKNWAKSKLPTFLSRPVKQAYALGRRRKRLSVYRDKPIAWPKTKAFAHGHYENIYLNVQGREPTGIVKPGAEYEEVRGSIRRGLENWMNPVKKERAVKQVWLKEELYSGPRLDAAPDLVVEWNDYAYVSSRGSNYRGPMADEVHCYYRNLVQSGSHRSDGILLATGPYLKVGQTVSSAHLQDIAPTVLYLNQLAIPDYTDGRILTELFDETWLAEHPPKVVPKQLEAASDEAETVFTPEESEELLERLKSLGYLE